MIELDQFLKWCDTQYSNTPHCQCGNACTNSSFCRGLHTDCYACIQRVHNYRNNTVHYNCDKQVLYYALKHTYRFGAEMFYELSKIRKEIATWQDIYIASIGCGPCSELFGSLSYWRTLMKGDNDFHYRGFDTERLWLPIMQQVEGRCNALDVHAFDTDAFAYYGQSAERIDIIELNYMLSDMMKFQGIRQYDQFLNNLIILIRQKKPRYLLVNDIYLLVSLGANNRMLKFLNEAGLAYKYMKLQYHAYHPYIGQFGRQIPKQPFVMPNAALVKKYDPFPETNSIQVIIRFQ